MNLEIHEDFNSATRLIKEELQILKHKMILKRMKCMLNLLKSKKRELAQSEKQKLVLHKEI